MIVDFFLQFSTDVKAMNSAVDCLPFTLQYVLHIIIT